MPHPLALVRTEIKSWERDFASRHGRDPSLQDIRDNPPIAEKYKLYKKLSKAAANPSTPPRTYSRLPVPKSRPAEPVPALPGFNPFSPVKKTAQQHRAVSPTSPHPNPFATSINISSEPRRRKATPDPDPFPPILPPRQSATPSSSRGHSVSKAAISRARKRLRGEPVSPSPNKPKRQRTYPQAPPPISKFEQDPSNSGHEPDQVLPQCDFTSSFVADSPVKASTGGKSFKLLFDDAFPAPSVAKQPAGSSIAHFGSPPDAGFSPRTSVDPSVPTTLKLYHGFEPNNAAPGSEHRINRVQDKISAQFFSTKDHLPAPQHRSTPKTLVSEVSQPRSLVKRALDDNDLVLEHTGLNTPLESQFSLVPPSPPLQDSINRDAVKGKAKTTVNRKKPRIEDEESDEGMDSPDDITLKIATVSLGRGKPSRRHVDDLGWDSLLHVRTPNHDLTAEQQIDANHHASDTFSMDLPDKFRHVLAVLPSLSQNVTEERVVRGLVYGDRAGHYHPSRGGDIWDAGETDEGIQGDIEIEDEWEGEPVPWEIGEL